MERLYDTDLNKLIFLCGLRKRDADDIAESDDASGLEKEVARFEAEYMEYLSEKLRRIKDSKAKRVEVRR